MAGKVVEKSPRPGIAAGAIYVAHFLLFAQFPRAGRLRANRDTWYAIAFTELFLNQSKALLGLGHYGGFRIAVQKLNAKLPPGLRRAPSLEAVLDSDTTAVFRVRM
jgi:hypothetical protein